MNLGKTTLNKIEQRLIEKYGTSLGESVKECSKLDNILREIFGEGATELESKFIQNNMIEQSHKNIENWIVFKELLVASIRKSIEVNLGKSTLFRIEKRLEERYEFDITQSIENFSKFDSVLREFFGAGAIGLKSRFIQYIINEKLLRKESYNFGVYEQNLLKEFLESFSDGDKKILFQSFSIKHLA